LVLDAQAWQRAIELLQEQGGTLVRQGRRETLRTLSERIPQEAKANAAQLDYWLGVASMIDDERRALPHFSRAVEQFLARGDGAMACLAAAQAVLAINLSWNSNIDGLAWVRRLFALLPHADALSEGERLTVSGAMLRSATMDETYAADGEITAAEVE